MPPKKRQLVESSDSSDNNEMPTKKRQIVVADTSDSSSDSDGEQEPNKLLQAFCSEAKKFKKAQGQKGTAKKVSLEHALSAFKLDKPRHKQSIQLFEGFLQRYAWEDCSCVYDDITQYTTYHSVDLCMEKADYFLTWYMYAKVMGGTAMRKRAATAMSVLIKFCVSEGWIEKAKSKKCLSEIQDISKSYKADDDMRGSNECSIC